MPKGKIGLLVSALLAFAVMGAAYVVLGGQELLNSSDRFKIWSFMMARWAHPQNLLFGTGLGTYHVFSINLQHYGNVAPGSFWSRMHNEWLQSVFETGIVGTLLFLAVYCKAIWDSFREKAFDIVACLILFGIYMGANSALHHAPPAIFGAWILVCALRREPLLKEQRNP